MNSIPRAKTISNLPIFVFFMPSLNLNPQHLAVSLVKELVMALQPPFLPGGKWELSAEVTPKCGLVREEALNSPSGLGMIVN